MNLRREKNKRSCRCSSSARSEAAAGDRNSRPLRGAAAERSSSASARGVRQSNSTQWTMLSETVAQSAVAAREPAREHWRCRTRRRQSPTRHGESGARSPRSWLRSRGTVIRVVGRRACRMSGVSRPESSGQWGQVRVTARLAAGRAPAARDGRRAATRGRFRACVAVTPEHRRARRGRGGRQRERRQQRARMPRFACAVRSASGWSASHGASVNLCAVRHSS